MNTFDFICSDQYPNGQQAFTEIIRRQSVLKMEVLIIIKRINIFEISMQLKPINTLNAPLALKKIFVLFSDLFRSIAVHLKCACKMRTYTMDICEYDAMRCETVKINESI